jgi:hypothetical protein
MAEEGGVAAWRLAANQKIAATAIFSSASALVIKSLLLRIAIISPHNALIVSAA